MSVWVCMSVIVWPRHHAPNFVILTSYICANFSSRSWCLGPFGVVHAEWPPGPICHTQCTYCEICNIESNFGPGWPCVCTKQVPGQYRELVLIMWTAFIPRLTNSSRGSFAHLLHWRRCKRYISKTVFFQLENLCFECRCFSLAESHVYQSWVSIFVH